MNSRAFVATILMLNLLNPINLFSQHISERAPLTFIVSGIPDNVGQVIVQLYKKGDDLPNAPFIRLKSKIKNRRAALVSDNLPYGDYAAIIFHDQNQNGELDHRFGLPNEPMTFTNNWELSLFSGMPSFEKLKFVYSAENPLFMVAMTE